MIILNDFNISVQKALEEIDPHWKSYNGLVICGTHTPHDTEMMIDKIREARENTIPFLGICFGHQLAAIEYVRNVLNMPYATSEEFGDGIFIVKKRPILKVGFHEGESWWSNFYVDKKFLQNDDENKNRTLVRHIRDNEVTEMMLLGHPFFVSVAYHPEYQSSKEKPHPILVKFLEICKN